METLTGRKVHPRDPGQHTASLRRVARGGFYSLAGTLVTAAAALGFTVIVTRSLGQRDAGSLFALTSAFLVAAAVIRLGAPTGLVYFGNRYRKLGEPERIARVWPAAYTPVIGLALVAGVAGMAAAPAISATLIGRDDAPAVLLTRALAAALVFAVAGDLAQGATRGFGAMRPLVLVGKVGRPGLQLLLALAVAGFGAADLGRLGLAWTVPFVLSAIALTWWARRLAATDMAGPGPAGAGRRRDGSTIDAHVPAGAVRQGGARARWPIPFRSSGLAPEWREFWRFTLPRSVASIAQVAVQRIDIVLIGVLAGPAPAALYTAATRLLTFGQMGAQALNQALESKVASLLAVGDLAGVRAVYRAATAWLMLLTWPVYLTLLGWAPELLAVFGPGYPAAAPAVVVLSLAMLLGTGVGAVDTMLTMAGRGRWTMFNASAALIVNVVLNVLLIPRLGITGAAVAWAGAIVVNNVVPLVQLAGSLKLHPFGRASVAAAGLPLVCFAVVPWLGAWPGPYGHLAGTLAGAALYAAALWRWRVPLNLSAFTAVRRR